jgi:hypothetical protein
VANTKRHPDQNWRVDFPDRNVSLFAACFSTGVETAGQPPYAIFLRTHDAAWHPQAGHGVDFNRKEAGIRMTQRKYTNLDAIRGLAAILIVLRHAPVMFVSPQFQQSYQRIL